MERLTVSVTEMARMIGISRPTAYELVQRSDFPVLRIGRRLLIPIKELETWLERNAYSDEHATNARNPSRRNGK